MLVILISCFFHLVLSTEPDWTSAIIGGTDAPYNSWIAPLIVVSWGHHHFCSGSIIHEKWVLSATHCFPDYLYTGNNSDIYVLGGVYNTSDVESAQKRSVKAIYLHPEYHITGSYEADIALIELESPFCLNDNVTIIDMATDDFPHEEGQEYTYTGWGWTSNYRESVPEILQELTGNAHWDCNASYFICTKERDEGICYGDSGGPMWRTVDSNPVLYGAISVFLYPKNGSCINQILQASTKVAYYQDWIEKITNFTEDFGYYIVQGSEHSECYDPIDSSCTTKVVDKSELWNVRCCADTDPGGWNLNSGCSVYTNSLVPECYTANWTTASQICKDYGGRLCSKEEFESPNLCSANEGCGFDNYMSWSSTVGIVPVAKNYIVQGSTDTECDDDICSTEPTNVEEEWSVRCCADEPMAGWKQNEGCSVFAQSVINQCAVTNWRTAYELCDSAGGRLCSREELEWNCAKNTGCLMNTKMVWSSDTGFEKYYIVKGATGRKCTENSCTTRAVDREELWSVRCCADTNPGDWKKNDGCSVYSSKGKRCSVVDWETAMGLCKDAGGRLCTREELEMNCARNTGCKMNSKMVWSSTEDIDSIQKHYAVKGASGSNCRDTSDPTCTTGIVDGEELRSVRCCAEDDPGEWYRNDGCSVWARSKIKICAATDLDTASNFCEVIGGRLCTKQELEANCAKGSGCNMNNKMVWSQTPEENECTSTIMA